MRIYFTEMSPFEAAFYFPRMNMIFVDEKFRKSEVLEEIVRHEAEHSKSTKKIDWDVDKISSLRTYWEIVKLKPLSVINPLIPILWWKYKENIQKGYDPIRFVTLFLLSLALILVLSLTL